MHRTRPLRLHRETLRRLDAAELRQVHGQARTGAFCQSYHFTCPEVCYLSEVPTACCTVAACG